MTTSQAIEAVEACPPTITRASVKVMRSHDYCHFEICLGSEYESGEILPHQVDALRKTAARLADKAVKQYQIAKRDAERRLADKAERGYLTQNINKIRATPEEQRTIGDQAKLKSFDDQAYQLRRCYDYEDDYKDDYDE